MNQSGSEQRLTILHGVHGILVMAPLLQRMRAGPQQQRPCVCGQERISQLGLVGQCLPDPNRHSNIPMRNALAAKLPYLR